MAIPKDLADLLATSRLIGGDRDLVQGGGGNTSVKSADGRWMWIKASGTEMGAMDRHRGWRRVRLSAVLQDLRDPSVGRLPAEKQEARALAGLVAACEDGKRDGSRPSVEAHIHAQLRRHVIHVHATRVGAFVSAKGGKRALLSMFAHRPCPPLWIPYCNPGFTLARRVEEALGAYEARHGQVPELVFQEKHGVFVSGATREEALATLRQVLYFCRKRLGRESSSDAPRRWQDRALAHSKQEGPAWEGLARSYGEHWGFLHLADGVVHGALKEKGLARVCAAADLTPDEIVYTHGRLVLLERGDAASALKAIRRATASGRPLPRVFLSPQGMFCIGPEKLLATIRDTARMGLQVRLLARKHGGARTLTRAEASFIRGWEVEKYREKLAEGRRAA